jgi:uncharacterized protein YdaU (DUF1376 family)
VKSPAFQIYPADFLADKNTLVMSAAEVGGYWLLLCVCWRENGLPDDIDELAAIARTPAKQFHNSWEKRIQRCFTKREDGKWTHKRLQTERDKQAENRNKRRDAGSKGAAERWQTDSKAIAMPSNGDSKSMANDSLSSSSSISSSTSTTSSEKEIQQRARRTPEMQGTRLPDDFCLNSEMREWATRETPHVDVDRAFAAFGDYWRSVPGAKGKKLDWLATWRNRLRDLEEHKTRGSRPASKVDESIAAARRVVAKYEQQQG